VSGRPLFRQRHVLPHGIGAGRKVGHVLEQRVQLEADVPVVPARLFPHRQKRLLRTFHKLVVKRPRDRRVVASLLDGAAIDWTKANVAQAFRIPSGAMEPTILAGDYLFVVPRRGAPIERDGLATYLWDDKQFLKRVAGVAGDTLEMHAGRLYRNARPVVEPYVLSDSAHVAASSSDFDWQRAALATRRDSASYRASADDWGPLVVPARRVFVLGDNRHNSLDSRYTGFVAEESVLGAPVSVYFSRDPETGTVRWSRIGRRLD
jgi:signal peptidase I